MDSIDAAAHLSRLPNRFKECCLAMRKIRRALALLCASICVTSNAIAQDQPLTPPLTLTQAIQKTLDFSPDLIVVRREVDAAAAARRQAGARPNPSISWSLEDTRQGGRSSTATLSQPLELGGKRAARLALADRNADIARADITQRSMEVRAAVIEFFYDVLANQDRVVLANASVDLARRGQDVAAKRVQAGRVSPLEETRARVAESTARTELSQAQVELNNARARLAALWGDAAPQFAQVAGDLASLPSAPAEATLLDRIEQAPELLRARVEVQQREAVYELARTQRIPEVSVMAGSRAITETGQRSPTVGLTVSIPIFDRNEGNIQEADVRTSQARDRLQGVRLRITADTRQALTRLNGARQQVSIIRDESLPGAQNALDAATRGFELGKFGFLDVLDAQRTLFAVRGQLIQAISEATRSAAELERLLGPIDAATAN